MGSLSLDDPERFQLSLNSVDKTEYVGPFNSQRLAEAFHLELSQALACAEVQNRGAGLKGVGENGGVDALAAGTVSKELQKA